MPDIDSISREFTGLARTARARLLAAAELSTPKMRAICEDVLADFARRNHGPAALRRFTVPLST
jgi:hypothetical protein